MNFDLKATLRERDLTQKAISERLGVSEATISLWGSALRDGRHRRVPAEKAKPLAAALGVPPSVIRPDLFDAPATQDAA